MKYRESAWRPSSGSQYDAPALQHWLTQDFCLHGYQVILKVMVSSGVSTNWLSVSLLLSLSQYVYIHIKNFRNVETQQCVQ